MRLLFSGFTNLAENNINGKNRTQRHLPATSHRKLIATRDEDEEPKYADKDMVFHGNSSPSGKYLSTASDRAADIEVIVVTVVSVHLFFVSLSMINGTQIASALIVLPAH